MRAPLNSGRDGGKRKRNKEDEKYRKELTAFQLDIKKKDEKAKQPTDQALGVAMEALQALSELAYQNPYGAAAVFELTCASCQELGYIISEFPDLEESFRSWRSYYPAIIAEDLTVLNTGLRTLARQGIKAQSSKLRKVSGQPRNDELSPESVFNYFLLKFRERILADPRHGEGPEFKMMGISKELIDELSKSKDAGVWADAFVEWCSNKGYLNPLPERPKEICWEEYLGFPPGILWIYAQEEMFNEDGKATPLGLKVKNSKAALRERARERMNVFLK